MIDIALLIILGLVAWCVASEGAWGAALIFLSTLFAGIIAINYFEPLAVLLDKTLNLGYAWANRWDFLAYMLLFIAAVFAIRLGAERIMPTFIEVHPLAHDGIRWVMGVMTGYLTVAIVLTSMHLTPLPRTFLGFQPERDNFLGLSAPDRQWLGYVQYMTEKAFTRKADHMFDGSTVKLSDGTEVVIPSFTVRYASRRAAGGGGANAPVIEAPPPVVAPSSGGGAMPF